MIEIIQPGQAGKTKSLIEMHQLRKTIFKDRMGWDVDISGDDLEIDDYDLPETVYFIARDQHGKAVGTWRMLPSTSPSMIRNIWPEFLDNFPYPQANNIWEASRFGVYSSNTSGREHINQVNHVTACLIWTLIKTCILTEITHIYTLYNPQVARSVKRIGFIPEKVSEELPVDGKPSVVGCFRMDETALARIENATGIRGNVSLKDLPPALTERATPLTAERIRAYA